MTKCFKRLMAVIAAISVFTASGVFSVLAHENYSFISDEEYRSTAIAALMEADILRGDENGNLGLDDGTKRGQIMALIIRSNNEEADAQTDEYQIAESDYIDDNEIADWERGFINYGTEKGYINGYPDGSIIPLADIKYEEAIKLVVAVKDGGKVYSYPNGYIDRASEQGWLKGVYGNIGEAITRESISTMIYNAFQIGDISGTSDTTDTSDGIVYNSGAAFSENLIKGTDNEKIEKEEMAITSIVNNGIMPVEANGTFDTDKEMTIAEVNEAVVKMAEYVADEANMPEFKNNIPQITDKGADEKASVQDVVDLLTEPGISLVSNEWKEMAENSIWLDIAFITLPQNEFEGMLAGSQSSTALAAAITGNPFFVLNQGYTASMIFKAIHLWKLLENWEDGYTATFYGKTEGYYNKINRTAVYDGSVYYYSIKGTENNGLYCENNGSFYRLVEGSVNLFGAYNGYAFYIDGTDICRIDKDGRYPRKIASYSDKIARVHWMIDGDYIYFHTSEVNDVYEEPWLYNGNHAYKVPVTSVDIEADKIEIDRTDFPASENSIIDNGNEFTVKSVPLAGNWRSFDILKNGESLIHHGDGGSIRSNIVLYNDTIYYFTNDDDVWTNSTIFRKVSRNGDLDFAEIIIECEDIHSVSVLSLAGDYAFIKGKKTLDNNYKYYKVNINESSPKYGDLEKFSIDEYTDLTDKSLLKGQIFTTGELKKLLTASNYNAWQGRRYAYWRFDSQGRDSSFAIRFNEDGTAIVGIGTGDYTSTPQYNTTYEIIDNETVSIKWDLGNWHQYVSDGVKEVNEDMPSTILKYVKDESSKGDKLETTFTWKEIDITDFSEYEFTPYLYKKWTNVVSGGTIAE